MVRRYLAAETGMQYHRDMDVSLNFIDTSQRARFRRNALAAVSLLTPLKQIWHVRKHLSDSRRITMKNCIAAFAVLLALASPTTFAVETSYTGTLSFVATDWNGAGFIFALTGVPGPCASGQFSIGASAPGYKDQVAVLLVLWAQGQQVTVVADGTCGNANRANIIGAGSAGSP
jgi:hypothetical protein